MIGWLYYFRSLAHLPWNTIRTVLWKPNNLWALYSITTNVNDIKGGTDDVYMLLSIQIHLSEFYMYLEEPVVSY